MSSIFFDWVIHFACHEWIGVLLKDSQTDTDAEINSFAVIDVAGVIFGVFDGTSTRSFIFR
jgi:hypothetical protein